MTYKVVRYVMFMLALILQDVKRDLTGNTKKKTTSPSAAIALQL
jgi:hypothetical protein